MCYVFHVFLHSHSRPRLQGEEQAGQSAFQATKRIFFLKCAMDSCVWISCCNVIVEKAHDLKPEKSL
jgi:hypothetical protein